LQLDFGRAYRVIVLDTVWGVFSWEKSPFRRRSDDAGETGNPRANWRHGPLDEAREKAFALNGMFAARVVASDRVRRADVRAAVTSQVIARRRVAAEDEAVNEDSTSRKKGTP